jgi:diaminopimelate epimerase
MGVLVAKGHATENDFIIVDDRDGGFELSPALVRALCDRHRGIGADGVLRVVRSENDPDGAPMAAQAPFFMDYRNADGSVAEMCGNGVRLFLRYLQSKGLVGTETAVATRGGIRRVWSEPDGLITVEMGPASILDRQPQVRPFERAG